MDIRKNKSNTIKYHVTLHEFMGKMGRKQILMFLLLPLFLLLIIFLNFRMVFRLARDNIEYSGEYQVKQYATEFEDHLKPGVHIMEYMAYNVEHMFKDGASREDILDFFVKESETFDAEVDVVTTGIYGYIRGEYMDGSGWVPDDDYVPTQRPWYIDAVAAGGEMTYVAPYVDEMTGDTIMTISKLLSDGSSVISIDFKMNDLQQTMDVFVAEDENGGAVIVLDEDGTVVAHTDAAEGGLNYFGDVHEEGQFIAKRLLTEGNEQFEIEKDGMDAYVFARSIGGGWYVLTVTDEARTFGRVFTAARNSILTAVAGLAIIFAVLIWMTKRRIEADNYNSNLQTVAGIYVCMYKMDIVQDTFEEISCKSEDLRTMIAGRRDNARDTLRELITYLSDDRSKAELFEFTDLDTLSERMKNTNSLAIEFMNHIDIWCRGHFVADKRDEDGILLSVIWMIEYIDEEKRARDRLLYLSETDRMTGINNRGCGESRIRKVLMEGEGGMFMLMDVDKFKSINDNYGHDVGDKVLISIADCMKHTFRDNDIVMRLGGDEFAVFTPLVYSHDGGGGIIADRFLERLGRVRIDEMGDTDISVSVGVAFYKPGDKFSFDELYKRADRCTYESKGRPGTQVTFYNEEILADFSDVSKPTGSPR